MAIVGIGTDIVEIDRIRSQLSRSDRLAKRVLSAQEFEQFSQHHAPAEFLAKRFAAKEAAAKAMGTGISGGMRFNQIWVRKLDSGQPELVFEKEALAQLEKLHVTSYFVSLSDEAHYAVATVVLERL